jgi:hypothetical protein
VVFRLAERPLHDTVLFMVFVFIEKDYSPLYKKCASADTDEKLAEIVVKMTTALKNFQF